mgnify:CR=1 FL=1
MWKGFKALVSSLGLLRPFNCFVISFSLLGILHLDVIYMTTRDPSRLIVCFVRLNCQMYLKTWSMLLELSSRGLQIPPLYSILIMQGWPCWFRDVHKKSEGAKVFSFAYLTDLVPFFSICSLVFVSVLVLGLVVFLINPNALNYPRPIKNCRSCLDLMPLWKFRPLVCWYWYIAGHFQWLISTHR